MLFSEARLEVLQIYRNPTLRVFRSRPEIDAIFFNSWASFTDSSQKRACPISNEGSLINPCVAQKNPPHA